MKGLFQCPPWARGFCPFRACGAYMRNLSKINLLAIFGITKEALRQMNKGTNKPEPAGAFYICYQIMILKISNYDPKN